jgi:hypothetical protein
MRAFFHNLFLEVNLKEAMMKRFSSLFAFIVCATAVPHIIEAWTYRYGEDEYADVGYCVQETYDSCYIVTGYTNFVSGGDRDLCLLKIDSEGCLLWERVYGGEWSDVGYSIQQTPDSGYIIAGCTDRFNEEGGADVWLLRTDPDGDSLWSRTYGGDSNDFASCLDQTSDGGYIIAGSTESFGLGKKDGWIIKTDSLGDTLWTRTYGGENNDSLSYVQQTNDGGYILTGFYTWSLGETDYDLWLFKTDKEGDIIWSRTYGKDLHGEGGSCVKQTNDGGYVVVGNGTNAAVCLLKTEEDGDTSWTKNFSSPYSGGRSV